MMRRSLALLALAVSLSACAGERTTTFEPSTKGVAELRAMQVRVVNGNPDSVMRDVVTTLHDLGYRITRADANTGTLSATRYTALRLSVVVQPKPPGQTVVRANATIVGLGRERQVDTPDFYAANFFRPLETTMSRTLALLPDSDDAPDAARPVAENNTLASRRRAATQAQETR